MCYICWQETNLKEPIDNERTRHVASLIAQIYAYSLAGGTCHIVLDDWNLEDHSIEWVLNYLDGKDEDGTPLKYPTTSTAEQQIIERQCMLAMKALTLDERASALRMYEVADCEDCCNEDMGYVTFVGTEKP
jgi:hypothetical protein